MRRSSVLILAIALIGILGTIVVKQRSTIESMRRERREAAIQQPSDRLAEPLSNGVVPLAGIFVESNLHHSEAVGSPLTPISAPPAAVTASQATDHERRALEAQVQQLQAELDHARRLIPEAEDSTAAYTGPGTWVNANAQTLGITKLMINGEAKNRGTVSVMTVKAWGKCSPRDCEWAEVPFYILDRHDGPLKYRRGLAVWDYESGARTIVLVTFEKTGLRLDEVRFRTGNLTPYSIVESLIRTQ